MTIVGLLPSTEPIRVIDSISGGSSEILRGFGYRLSISSAISGDDIWTGPTSTIPIPPDVGEQMQVQSTSDSDDILGTGVRTLHISYIDANGLHQYETINMDGTNPTPTTATDIRFVQEIHGITTGSNLLSEGIITISKLGDADTVYTQIQPQTNQSLNTARMVPASHVLVVRTFNGSSGTAAGGKSADIRLRVTNHGFNLTPRVFHFVDNFLSFNSSTSRTYPDSIIVPELSIVKCTSYTTVAGADVQASWEGVLVPTPV